jgi:F-type H+-transporting ATPase subunit delta
MNALRETLAKRYAKTLYKLYGTEQIAAVIKQLEVLAVFFSTHKEQLVAICSGNIARPQAQDLAEGIIKKCSLQERLQYLLANLIQEHRTQLLAPIAQQLRTMLSKNAGILNCTVYSSHPLEDEQKKTLERFINKEIKAAKIVVTFEQKDELISGIRIVCDELMWERSIRKTLLHIKQQLLQQV